MRTAMKRLLKEYRELEADAPEGIVAAPKSEDNLFEWHAYILGPDDTAYEGGFFSAELKFPQDYPLSPPTMRFTCPMYHPNLYPDGRVCISILHAPGEDPNMYESSSERWSPVQSVEKILLSVVSMLAEPNDESPANVEAAVSQWIVDWGSSMRWNMDGRKCGEPIGESLMQLCCKQSSDLWVFHKCNHCLFA